MILDSIIIVLLIVAAGVFALNGLFQQCVIYIMLAAIILNNMNTEGELEHLRNEIKRLHEAQYIDEVK